jgi:hypothetical protein
MSVPPATPRYDERTGAELRVVIGEFKRPSPPRKTSRGFVRKVVRN